MEQMKMFGTFWYVIYIFISITVLVSYIADSYMYLLAACASGVQ